MIFIYNCYGGTHSSSLASAIHLNKLPQDRIPTKSEILNTDYFNKLSCKDMGRIIYRGMDEEGNKVFSLGRGTSRVLLPCLKNLIVLLQQEWNVNEKILLSNMTPTVTLPMTVGGFLSRRLRIDSIGVPLLVMGAQQAYKEIVEVVNFTKESAKTLQEPVLLLLNSRNGRTY
ncbi:DUF3189 family protein [Desulforamulus ruminis]|uniref:Uncharacterized protein n=1 Tax=Desulforamulus ruminis (strain ATCC 23193 / DSM 2154 / NCIMB 8452 / DL) TaxID=696281 RepID=F6DUJ5_DESRL|nr:DUF3189 family protein [Desulforamulus ruminis]AEG59062.1 hypothetical protein Desru_0780 [Desulforamulus ruminis DSM 2154]